MVAALLIVLGIVVIVMLPGILLSGPKYKGPITDHFDGKKFFVPEGRPAKGLGDVFKWMIGRKRTPWKEHPDLPFGEKPPDRINHGLRITFVNHSTFLIQVDGLNILTDPVWSKRVSPFQWAGPARMRPPGIRFEDLPKIDLILLSHNHYDHLDLPVLQKLYRQHSPKIVTALGVGLFLEKQKISSSDLDWWEEFVVNDSINIQSVPAQHFSGRGTLDRDATLWCGFVIRRPGGNIYFVGDTGYNKSIFQEIANRCSPIHVSIVPIGAFKPEWFMSPIHCSPSEAVKIHQEIRSGISIATHFGTFPLADDGEDEPVSALQVAMEQQGVSQEKFVILKEGEGRDF